MQTLLDEHVEVVGHPVNHLSVLLELFTFQVAQVADAVDHFFELIYKRTSGVDYKSVTTVWLLRSI